MKIPDESSLVPSVVLQGRELGKELNDEVERIQALYTLAGIRKSKSSVIIEMMQRGVSRLSDEVKRLAKEKGAI